jgi:glycosyltransferase involved in cell wall biosynthesis
MQNKEILIITNYFPPESGAASNRINSMVNGFYKNNYTVSVVCPFPNYPDGKTFKGHSGSIYKKTEAPFGNLFRLWIWPTKSKNKFIRLLSMISFSLSLMIFLIFKKTPKKVIIQYSPVLVGFTAVFWIKFLRKKIILNVSDLWPLAGLEMGLLKKGFYYNILLKMEKYCYKESHLILGQSEEILIHIQSFEINSPLFLYRNYPDFSTPQLNIDEVKNEKKIVYAGLLGVAQGLYKICSEVTFTKNISLHIYGSGPETELIKTLKKPNVYYYGAIEREQLHKELLKCDLGFVPLINRIYGSVPSKIFELSRLGLPILYFAGGEGGDIVTDNNLGWNIPVSDYEKLQVFIDSFSKDMLADLSKNNIQSISENRFSFEKQFDNLIKEIEGV